MLEGFAAHAMTIKRKGAVSGANEVTFSSGTIYGRLQSELKKIKNDRGEEVVSHAQFFTSSSVVIGDRLVISGVEFPVISVGTMRDIDDEILWYEVFV